MSKISILTNMSKETLSKLTNKHKTKKDLLTSLNLVANGSTHKILNSKLKEYGLTLVKTTVVISKICPVCNSTFKVYRSDRNQITCSVGCANTYFRSGTNNGAHKAAVLKNDVLSSSSYRTICFSYHKHECIICGENRIVQVHHFDKNIQNNDPDNLIPLCPTHHSLYHSNFKEDVEPDIIHYRTTFLKSLEE